MRKKYQRQERKSNHKFEVVGGQELTVRVPLPMAEMWVEMQAQVEQLGCRFCERFWRRTSLAESAHHIGRIPALAACAGGSSRVMWFLVDRRFPWSGHGYEPAKVRK